MSSVESDAVVKCPMCDHDWGENALCTECKIVYEVGVGPAARRRSELKSARMEDDQ